ncbi:MarR family winged helix-turn-helix transcriptional regulator [Solicola gregarius]|uniref:MarR family winged helix-turn-helix transcriptional regulator n=1 Tax=Solicola gregarius TaxID=2908642 RepID=A0AA46YKD8_9ACTN|nr:MarR family winged helix-turn-helix transcriptional regulator [Solicola gregarius]UYM04454.1 MarR family winged helix-turn-helix transcriptional regulator [Solicola gregarius]
MAARPIPLGNLLSAATRTLVARLDSGLADAGFDDLRAAHAPVLQAIDGEGSRMTDLADRAAMTKQAMRELVVHLQERGYVEVVRHPEDGRAKLVMLTGRGWRAIDAGVGIIDTFDGWLDGAIGQGEVQKLRVTLQRIIDHHAEERIPAR